MISYFKRLYGRILAWEIERAMNHPSYTGDRTPFLCSVLYADGCLFEKFAREHIASILGRTTTLRLHLAYAVPRGTFPHRWEDREVYHRRFWIIMCRELRKGNFDWGRKIDLVEMGMTHFKEPEYVET